jgi:hypothetical protein
MEVDLVVALKSHPTELKVTSNIGNIFGVVDVFGKIEVFLPIQALAPMVFSSHLFTM